MKQKSDIKKWCIPVLLILMVSVIFYMYLTSKGEEPKERGILVENSLSVDTGGNQT